MPKYYGKENYKKEGAILLRKAENLWQVRFKRAGKNEYKAKCPYHAERTASFYLNIATGEYHCFGCGVGGNIKLLLGEKFVPGKARVVSETPQPRPDLKRIFDKSDLPDYSAFAKRGISRQTVNAFGARGINLYNAGWMLNWASDKGYKAKFVNGWPLWWNKDIVGCQLWWRNENPKLPKYIIFGENTMSSCILSAGLKTTRYAFIVEGMIDAMSIVEYGFPVITIFNSSMGDRQIEQIPKHITTLIIMLDNYHYDSAARKGIKRILEQVKYRRPEIVFYKYKYPMDRKVKDPNDLLTHHYPLQKKDIEPI